ncbi:alpha/beta hydrolase [Aerophototrophica crusticola]|uniref:Alpha/beta hydrolase n=1 Tax=Aerophototrophica crusticola TaxID=1709002 RepID=A0A858R372_9PROT|nr:alpha/beta hydrolase [Rhodospirillaceae bacterium B3]
MPARAQTDGTLMGGYQAVTLSTARGEVKSRFYAPQRLAESKGRGVIWVGGVGGGWDSPARDLYARLALELAGEDLAGLRVRYRKPGELEECLFDLLTAARFLETKGVNRLGIVGHSFGGAVAVQAAAKLSQVRAVVTLATQGRGAEPASRLGPRVAMLMMHGTDDEVLPVESTEYVNRLAKEPKQLVIFNGARHLLDEVADRVHREVRDWLLTRL